jgi:hypothetical protein
METVRSLQNASLGRVASPSFSPRQQCHGASGLGSNPRRCHGCGTHGPLDPQLASAIAIATKIASACCVCVELGCQPAKRRAMACLADSLVFVLVSSTLCIHTHCGLHGTARHARERPVGTDMLCVWDTYYYCTARRRQGRRKTARPVCLLDPFHTHTHTLSCVCVCGIGISPCTVSTTTAAMSYSCATNVNSGSR